MAYVETYPAVDRQEVLRWSVCAVAVFLVHGLVLLALWTRPDYEEPDAGAPVVLIELAPLAVAPSAPETDVAPGPEQFSAMGSVRLTSTGRLPDCRFLLEDSLRP